MQQAQALPTRGMPELPALLTVAEVAATLRLDPSTVWRMTRDGRIRAVRLGGRGASIRIPRAELERLLAAEEGTA